MSLFVKETDQILLILAGSTGASTGLVDILSHLPVDLGVPILSLLHLEQNFSRSLLTMLANSAKIPTKEIQDGEILKPNQIHLPPGNHHLLLQTNENNQLTCRLQSKNAISNCCPSADLLFSSLIPHYKGTVITAILSGLGNDGLLGLTELKNTNQLKRLYVVAQDRSTSAAWGMPGSIIEAGLASRKLPLPLIAEHLTDAVKNAIAIADF